MKWMKFPSLQGNAEEASCRKYVWNMGEPVSWVVPINLNAAVFLWFTILKKPLKLYTIFWFQEDDMDGIHIVAFAEEEDPGLDLFLHHLFTCCLQHPGLGSHGSSVVPRWLRVSGDSQRRSKRQHQQPRAQHRLDRPWWLSSSSVSSLALFQYQLLNMSFWSCWPGSAPPTDSWPHTGRKPLSWTFLDLRSALSTSQM